MIPRSLTLALAVTLASAAWAQSSPPSTPATTTVRDVTAPSPSSSATGDDRPSGQDPRVCLEFPTREQVIACAERFRPKRAATKA